MIKNENIEDVSHLLDSRVNSPIVPPKGAKKKVDKKFTKPV
jgi:hypothetical protein